MTTTPGDFLIFSLNQTLTDNIKYAAVKRTILQSAAAQKSTTTNENVEDRITSFIDKADKMVEKNAAAAAAAADNDDDGPPARSYDGGRHKMHIRKTKKYNRTSLPARYIPKQLSSKDKKRQLGMLMKSRKLYKSNKYFTRKKVSSFKSKKSSHIENAKRIYKINKITPNKELALKTGCSLGALKKIVRKGEGAYYSSGSRPNQTPQSWGLARLASSITGGNASVVDFDILKNGCTHNKRAFLLANKKMKNK